MARAAPGPVLDVGCATGRLAFEVASRLAAPVIGVDMSRHHLQAAHARLDAQLSVTLCRADATRLPVMPGAVETVMLVNLLDRVRDPRLVLAECRRIMRRGGTLLVALTHDWAYGPNPIDPTEVPALLASAGFAPSAIARRELIWALPDAVNPRHMHLYRVEVEMHVRE